MLDPTGVLNTGRWVGIEHHQIGKLPRFNGTQRIFSLENPGDLERRGVKGIGRRQSRFDREFKLVVKRRSGWDLGLRRIGADKADNGTGPLSVTVIAL